jgi:tRNA pseudouridine65 synthase
MNTSTQPEIDQIEIIYEDEYIVAVNKPNNFLVHHSHYARNIVEETLLDKMKHQRNETFFPIHRLDRKTSGLLLCAKEKENVAPFQALFNDYGIEKYYVALVRGYTDKAFEITSPVKHPESGRYKEALTLGETLGHLELPLAIGPYEQSRYSLVKLLPKTGRIHQLRIHMNKISHPIIGDSKYGDRFHNRMFEEQFNCQYMFLHAQMLYFNHPLTDEQIELKASFPVDWKTILPKFDTLSLSDF